MSSHCQHCGGPIPEGERQLRTLKVGGGPGPRGRHTKCFVCPACARRIDRTAWWLNFLWAALLAAALLVAVLAGLSRR